MIMYYRAFYTFIQNNHSEQSELISSFTFFLHQFCQKEKNNVKF